MTVFKGSQKEGKVYKGGTKIGKIYKGSQLVYQSQKQLRLYSYDGVYAIGGQTTSNLLCDRIANTTITNISGTLGTSNSSVSINNANYPNFINTITTNGIKIHIYRYTINSFNGAYVMGYVMENSKVGDCALCFSLINYNTRNSGQFPTSINNTSLTYIAINSSYTNSRTSSNDKTWTINGVY